MARISGSVPGRHLTTTFSISQIFDKFQQLIPVEVRGRPVSHPLPVPEYEVVAPTGQILLRLVRMIRRPFKEVDVVLTALIDQCRRRMTIDIIQPATNKREAHRSQIPDAWREVQPPIEPGLDGMLVRRWHVFEVIGHQRSDMTVYYF
jgi:hypothetical protein